MSWISLIIPITMTDLTHSMNHVPSIASSNFLMLFSHSDMSDSVTPYTARTQDSPAIQISQRFIQSHVLWVNDAFQPSHPLSFPSSSALYLSQHQFLPSDFPLGLKRLIYWLFMCSISPSENNMKSFPSHFISLNSILTMFSPALLL